MESRKIVLRVPLAEQQRRCRHKEQTFGHSWGWKGAHYQYVCFISFVLTLAESTSPPLRCLSLSGEHCTLRAHITFFSSGLSSKRWLSSFLLPHYDFHFLGTAVRRKSFSQLHTVTESTDMHFPPLESQLFCFVFGNNETSKYRRRAGKIIVSFTRKEHREIYFFQTHISCYVGVMTSHLVCILHWTLLGPKGFGLDRGTQFQQVDFHVQWHSLVQRLETMVQNLFGTNLEVKNGFCLFTQLKIYKKE